MTCNSGERFSFGPKDSKYFNQMHTVLVLFSLPVSCPSDMVEKKPQKNAKKLQSLCVYLTILTGFLGREVSGSFLRFRFNPINRFD